MKTPILIAVAAMAAALFTVSAQTPKASAPHQATHVCEGCSNPPCDTSAFCCRPDGTINLDPDPTGGVGDDGVTCNTGV